DVLQENISAMRARPTRCSCLGLGSPESSDAARVQLAFLLYICDTLDLKKSDVTLYDPEFSDNDYKLFEDLGLRGLRTEPAHIAEGPTLYYMIHCEMTLYDEILRANESYLDRILLVGNRLHHYLENKPSHELEESASTLLRLALQITADVLRPSPGWPNSMAFTAVQ
ncbi:SRR1-domain-containing protein, partial [Schizophyllum fasciatum]